MNGGRWGNEQIIPAQWVNKSLTIYSPRSVHYGMGYAWSMPPEKTFKQKCYTAEGSGGHIMMLFPESDMIVVHRANTYVEPWIAVDWTAIKKIVQEIFAARREVKTTVDESKLLPHEPDRTHWPALIPDDPAKTRRFEKYYHNDGDPVTILREGDGQLIVNIPYLGNFNLYAMSDSTFFVEGKEEKIYFEYDDKREPVKAIFP